MLSTLLSNSPSSVSDKFLSMSFDASTDSYYINMRMGVHLRQRSVGGIESVAGAYLAELYLHILKGESF